MYKIREGRSGIRPKINLEHSKSAEHHCNRKDLGGVEPIFDCFKEA
jgi:hypothetical protein